ncbi:hypothetical protein D3C80_1372990 [compost metagenome]
MQPLVEIEVLPLALTQALHQQITGGRGRLQPFLGPFGQLADQKEVTVLITGIDGTIAGAVGQHFRQLGQIGEARLQIRHLRQLAAAQQAQGHAGRTLVQLERQRQLLPIL